MPALWRQWKVTQQQHRRVMREWQMIAIGAAALGTIMSKLVLAQTL